MSVDMAVVSGTASWFSDSLLRVAGGSWFLAVAVFCIFTGAFLSPRGGRVVVMLWRLFLGLLVVVGTIAWVLRYLPDFFAVVGVVGVLVCAWIELLDFGRDDSERGLPGSTDGRQGDE